jgi:alanine racemase
VSLPDLSTLRPTRAEVSLDALEENLAWARRQTGGRPLLAVVKANAYGHGAVEIARCLESAGVEHLAVALLEEARELRRHGVTLPILVMGALEPAQMPEIARIEATPAVFRSDQIEALERCAAEAGRRLPVHLKVDTGMGRLGARWDRCAALLDDLARRHHLELQGIFSHLATADDPASGLTALQIDRFARVAEAARERRLDPPLLHLANSAAVLDRPPAWLSMVRPGLLLYGYRPSTLLQDAPLRPVLRLSTRIVLLKEIEAGDAVGYGATFVASRRSRIATLAAGYDDGVRRSLSNRGRFLVAGRPAPIVGRVSMDLTTLDVTGIPQAREGDEAVLIGGQGEAFQGADQVADDAGTISWEILCGIGWRVPRIYRRGDRVVAVRSRFGEAGEGG